MAAAVLPVAVFGCRPRVAGGVCFLEEQVVLHAAGAGCLRLHLEHKWHNFIPGTEKSRGVQALAVSPNRRFLAVSEAAGEQPVLAVYELSAERARRRRALATAELPARQAVSLAFSPDGRYLAAATAMPEGVLTCWLWEKHQLEAAVRLLAPGSGPCQVSFSPQDSTQLCITGNGFFKLFKYSEGNLKQMNLQKGEPENYLCHAWLSEEKVVCGTDTGKLSVFETGELHWETNLEYRKPPRELEEDITTKEYESSLDVSCGLASEDIGRQHNSLPQISAVAAYSKGFACSPSPGVVLLFEKTKGKEAYEESQEIWLPQDQFRTEPKKSDRQDITCICFSPSEETMVISTNKNQLYMFPMVSTKLIREKTSYFAYLNFPLHSDSITGLDMCIWKPILATCSLDRSVRIWNYKTNTLELCKEYQEEAYTVSLHPTGLFCLVGFSDKLRFISLLYEDMHVFKEFAVRKCRECSFSNGGHLFAAVNGNVIQIYSSITFDNVSNLKGHSGKIHAIKWSTDDAKFVSCDTHGAVFEWNLMTGKRESECVLKTCIYSSISLSSDAKIIFAVGSDQTLKEISESSIQHEVPAYGVVYTAVAVSHSGHVIYVGTSLGTIRAMKYPLTLKRDFHEYQAHAGAVTKMSVTSDDQFLLTASEDGCIFIWKVHDKEGGALKGEAEAGYAEEVLIMKSDIDEKSQAILDLQICVKDLQTESDYELRLKDLYCTGKIKALEENFTQEIDSLKAQHQILQAEKEKQELQYECQLSELVKKQAREVQQLESASNKKLLMENERYEELQVKSQRMQEAYERQLHSLEESKSTALKELTERYEEKLKQKSALLEQTKENMRRQIQAHEEMEKQIYEDGDKEISEIKNKYEKQLSEEKESNTQLKGEIGVMNKRLNNLQKELKDRIRDIEEMRLEQQKLENVIRALEKDILALKTEIKERSDTILDKEKHIYDLKMKNQELQNFKFVLSFKIEEFKKQIESRENDIKTMKEQIQEMEEELEGFHKESTQLKLNITQLQQKLKASYREMDKERQKKQDMETVIKRFKADLHNCVGFIQDSRKMKDGIRELYSKYVQQSDVVEAEAVDTDLQKQYMKQQEYHERSLAVLKKKVMKDQEMHQAAYMRLMQENVSLIKEINDLRQELKVANTQVHDLRAALRLNKKKKAIQDTAPSSELLSGPAVLRLNPEMESEKIIEIQQLEIQYLRDQIQEKGQVLTVQVQSPLVRNLPELNLERSCKTQQH
ncbi:LOW QUALITY PROTEIN: cilia- and flagella-associated protein 57 [Corapipo altera]|uniref:LOW QUALITY PROTEIN: cilia- and flagella-associated protein 57 n=1 Tax=Corapipo altera TaxID=415028 RepID=UPI000FD69BFD|nr:LOW QUALITY PROTEIN: cilia- and flagella-associated protein 57 [Corapipo altera]